MYPFDVKICGLKTPEAIEAAISRGASHVGFVHFARSPRHLAIEPMAALRDLVGSRAETVIVTVDPDDELIERFAATVRPDWLQLHGGETSERVAAIKANVARHGIRVMKALPVAEAADLAAVARYRDIADRILLDSRRPKGSQLPGGNGVAFDWTLLSPGVSGLDPALPVMLSGGLDAANAAEALRVARPAGLDISSGVESAPGVKDVGRIHQFFDALDRFGAPAGKVKSP